MVTFTAEQLKAKIEHYKAEIKQVQNKLNYVYSSGTRDHTRWSIEQQRLKNLVHKFEQDLKAAQGAATNG